LLVILEIEQLVVLNRNQADVSCEWFTMFRFFCSFSFFLLCFFSQSQQLIINEVSQGTGSAEYVEFVVIGSPTCVSPVPCMDLRKVIIDDNNGYFAPGSNTGIASGAVRFANTSFWQCIPQGTFIVVYNSTDPNSSLPPDDISTTDGNCRLIIPSNSNLLEKTVVSPTTTITTYPPDSDWTSGGSWSPLSMNNTNDSFLIPNLSSNGVPLHSVSWGNNSNNTIIYFSGSASGKVFSFENTISNNWNSQANWVSGTVAVNQTPGSPNSSQNDAWISTMNPQCSLIPGMTVALSPTNESCLNACDGAISASVSNGLAPFTYSWSTGQTTATITDLCPGTYALEVTSSTGCSASQTIQIQQGTAVSVATIQASGPFIISDSPQQLTPPSSGGNWLSNCSTCLSAAGLFNPQVAGVGIWEICYAIGSGNCSDTSCIFVEVTSGCLPQITSENLTICSEDSIQVFGNWEFQIGEYSQSFIDVLGCDSTHTITLNHFEPQNSSETLLFCENDSVFVFGNWEFQTGEYSQSFMDIHGCDSTHTIALYHFDSQNSSQTLPLCENDSVFVFGSWHFSAGTLVEAGITQNGCAYTNTVTIIQEICNVDPPVIYIPNVFTPDGDFVNELFKLEVLGGIIEKGYVFNRWGNTVFTFDENTVEWDGNDEKTGLPVQDGVYTYLVYFKPAYSPLELYHGFVTIIR